MRRLISRPALLLWALCLVLQAGCGLFEPRDPEAPSQGGLNYRPPTAPEIVIANLQSAIDQKSSANYINCFTDPSKTGRLFEFIPAVEASAVYPGIFDSWSRTEEEAYFQNLIAKSIPNSLSSLLLKLNTSVVTPDSVLFDYDYTLTFEHTDPSFPMTAKGRLQFSLATDNSNFWSIHRWQDFKSATDEATWSLFKGKFSN